MNVREILNRLAVNGVVLKAVDGRIEVEGKVSTETIQILRSNKIEILNQIHGLKDIRKGIFVADEFSVGKVIDVYPDTGLVGYQCQGSVHPKYLQVWKLQPIVKIPKASINFIISQDRGLWADLLCRGINKVKNLSLNTEKEKYESQKKSIAVAEEYLECNWDTLSVWRFSQYLETYLQSHVPFKGGLNA